MSRAGKNLDGIAIVGMSGRFPKARNLDEFWRNLCNGVESVSFFTDEELAESGVTAPRDSNYVKARAILDNPDLFDAAFFGMNPKEAETTDPQHRIFLECAWEALENSGCDPHKFPGAIGVFAGLSTNTYLVQNLSVQPQLLIGINGEFQAMIGNDRDFLPTRVSYKLNLKGPSLNIQTACSTSLVAVCVACQHLLTQQCDLALAGAVSISFPQKRGYVYQEGSITSPDGHCRPFDANSAGTVAGEGCGVVALKRLEDAITDGDPIYAVIKGFATNNDGGLKVGYTAPSVEGQAEVIAMAQAMAGFEPRTISYIEAHGTATPLGDPIEIEGLNRAFRLGTDAKNFCAIGSIKGNIGHLDTAAGIAGLIKTALALHHKKIPPSANFKSPNPAINFADSPFFVNTQLLEWKTDAGPRRAGISSFGIGGTNAHVVLEEAPALENTGESRPAQLLLLSAKTPAALESSAANLAAHLKNEPQIPLADVAYTLQTGRHEFAHRRALACKNADEAIKGLQSTDVASGLARRENPPVVFMFTGQGAQRVNMGRELYDCEPVFRNELDRCAELLRPHLNFDLRELLFPEPKNLESAKHQLTQTAITQPAMFAFEYALAKLWMTWGVQPEIMIGHSLGEYVAACLAGVFSLPDALRLIAARGRMMQELPAGTMLAVRLLENEIQSLLADGLSLAAVNAPSLCVVSGANEPVEKFRQKLSEKNIASIPLQTSHAFHSAMMEPILAPFIELVRSIERRAPQIPFVSNLTGKPITNDEAADPSYWAGHLRRTVRFAQGVGELLKNPDRVLLEIGPGQTLANLAKQQPAQNRNAIIASLPQPGSEELIFVLNALGQLWVAGVSPDWKNFYARERRRRVWLPNYPFERKRYWVEPAQARRERTRELLPRAEALVRTEQFAEAAGGALKSLAVSSEIAETISDPGESVRAPRLVVNDTVARLRNIIARLSGLEIMESNDKIPFTQMGFDSLFLTQASVAVEKEFGVRVAFRQLLEEFPTLNSLAAHLETRIAPRIPTPAPAIENGNGNRAHVSDAARDFDKTVPLTESQRELWFASQMSDAASCVYNECRLLHLRGDLRPDALRAALQTLVNRHEALRTTFSPAGEAQKIHASLTLEMSFADWCDTDAASQTPRLHAVQIEEARQPFDLVRGPLVRARLIRMSREHHVFVMTVHHIVCDGFSFGILLRELGELYSAECLGVPALLPAPLQFSTYARERIKREQSPEHDADENFWVKQFQNGAPVLELPTDHSRGSVWKFEGARAFRSLPGNLTERLKAVGAQCGCTLFTTLLASYALLLRRLSRQTEIVIGIPMADRAIEGGETLAGHCVNFLPMRSTIRDEHTFAEHLAGVQKSFLDADEHGRYAFGSLVQKLNLARDPSRMPIVSATFNMERRTDDLNFANLRAELFGNAHSATAFDINFDVTELSDGLQLDCRYNTSLFSAKTVERWLEHFQTLLEDIVAAPREPVHELRLLSEPERRKLLTEWSGTRTNYPREKCVHEIFEEQALKTPHAIALEFSNVRMTYRELNQRANLVANNLRHLGVGPDVVVAVCIERSFELIVALLGILKAGGAYLSLDFSNPWERLEFMLKDANAKLILTQKSQREKLKFEIADLKFICMDEENSGFLIPDSGSNAKSDQNRNSKFEIRSSNLAYISFTSGSTGQPKGVCVPHRGVVRLVKNTNYASFASHEVFLQLAPIAFDASTFEIWGALLNGARLVIFPPHAPSLAELGDFIQERRITTLWLTAGLFHQMIEEQIENLRDVRQLLAGGDVLSISHVREALEKLPDCRLINGYGPTENATFTCCHSITESSLEHRAVPIGRPISNTQVYILDEHLQPTSIGVPGELHIGGDGLARGYLNRKQLTAQKFIPNPFSAEPSARLYKTGDLARWLPNGDIEFLGRADTQVKVRGFRVELDEIETALNQHPGIRRSAVIAQEHKSDGKRLTAYFVATALAQPSSEELREHLRRSLPDYMIPGAFVRVDSLPLNSSGKVDRKLLSATAGQRVWSEKTFVATSDDLEKRLAELWENVLDQKPVGANDDFFDLGGHSLLAMRLVARIESVFGKKIPVASVFHARTVAQMANLLRDKLEPQRNTSVVGIQTKGARPPLLFVHGAGGGMFWGYTKLSRHLGHDQPVYGFKSRGMDQQEELSSIEELAAQYIADLKAFQPNGPYYLGGYCFGGNVAYEMARELRAQGKEVALLALINCVPPNSSYDTVRVTPRFFVMFIKNLIYWAKYFLRLPPEQQREILLWKFRATKKKFLRLLNRSADAPPNFDIEEVVDLCAQPESRRSLWETHVHALFKHHPKPYDGDVVLFRTRGHSMLCSFDDTFGWRDLVKGNLTVRVVPGAHETILDEPHVRALAREFEGFLKFPELDDARKSQLAKNPASKINASEDCIHHLFERQAAKTPDATAVVFKNESLSYRELNLRADKLGAQLRSMGAGPDVPIAICLDRSIEMVVGVLAILKSESAYVPLDPAYPKERLKLMIETARAPVLLTRRSLRENFKFEISNLKFLCVDEENAGSRIPNGESKSVTEDVRAAKSEIRNSNLAYVIFTSGSTGTPKGVAMPHRPLVNLIRWQLKNSGVGAGRTLQFASLSFDVSFQEMFSTWCAGGTLVLIDEKLRRDPVALLRFMDEQKIARLFLPFIGLQQLAEAFSEQMPEQLALRETITAGEQLQITPKIVRMFQTLKNCTLHNHYGPSESHVVTAFTLAGPPDQWPALPPIGKPIDSAQIFLLDENRKPVKTGDAGEIYIGGDCLARGYLHRADLTAERFVTNPFSDQPDARLYKTGDLGRVQSDGNIEFLGRIDHQVKIRGFRIELGEIEAALQQFPKIREAVVTAREDKPGSKRLVAYFISNAGQTVTSDELRNFLKEKLPDYMVPALFVPIESLPLTPSGKVDRKRLPAPETQDEPAAENIAPPRTPAEESLVAIWREVLGAKRVGIHDDFFSIGGDSLLATQIISRIRATFQIEVPVDGVFEFPTVAALAENLDAGRWEQQTAPAILPVCREGGLPLSFSQQRLWFIEQLQPGNFAYNMPVAIELDGELNAIVLEQCLNEIIARHEILRTTFVIENDVPAQKISPQLALTLSLVDLSEAVASKKDEVARNKISEESKRPFNLATGPLIRAVLFRIEPRKHTLLVTMHHIVSDGWSLSLLIHELAALYESKISDKSAALPEPPIQYADFAVWQRKLLQGKVLEQHLDYWKNNLATAPSRIELPVDRAGKAMTDMRGAQRSIVLPQEIVESLRAANRRQGTTSFMTLLAALTVTLQKWTKQNDLVIGTVSAGRTRRKIEALIGCFMNFLPIRAKFSGDETGAKILAQIKRAVLEAHAHLDCPFEKIVEAINPQRDALRNPIYNVGFLLENYPKTILQTPQLTGKFKPVETDTALLDLRFIAEETDSEISLACEYRVDLFEPETIEQVLISFGRVLATLVQQPETKLSAFEIASGLTRQSEKIREEATADTIAITATFTAEPLEESLRFWLSELGIAAKIEFAPYNQVFQQLLDPASALSKNARGLNVLLLRLQSWLLPDLETNVREFIASLRAAAGRNAIRHLVCVCPSESQDISLLRMEKLIADELSALPNVQLIFPKDIAAFYPVTEIHDPQSDALGNVPYTAAFFTALATMIARKFHFQKRPAPKVIALDCDNTLWRGVCGEDGAGGIEINAPHRALQQFMRAQLDAGRLLCLCTKNNEDDVHAVFEKRAEMPLRREHFAATRINWQAKSENLKSLAEELNLGLDSFVFVDDNPVECAEVEANCPGVHVLQLPEAREEIPDFLKHCWIFDIEKATAEDKHRTAFYQQNRERNELLAKSPSLADFLAALDLKIAIEALSPSQLARAAQLTQRTNQFNCTTRRRTETELQDLLKTSRALAISVRDRFGDYGLVGLVIYKIENDALAVETFLLSCRILGRGVEHRILSHLGKMAQENGAANVDIHFVASAKNKPALDFLENVGQPFRQALNGGYVFRFPSEIAAAVTLNPQDSPQSSATTARKNIEMTARNSFTRWRWIATEANRAEKILELIESKTRIPAKHRVPAAEPRNDLERKLRAIWEQLLRVHGVSIRDNFFELGGHSLLAVRLFAQIEKQLGAKLPIVTIFQSPTIEQLADAIVQLKSQPSESVLLPIQPNGDKSPLFLVHGAGGDVLWGYANLANCTDADQPIYGIQACGREEFPTLEDMAAHYVERLREFQPQGPYFLGGYCFGGNVAQEMARQLELQGEHVALLALLDCAPSNCGYETARWWHPRFVFDFTRNLSYWLDDFSQLTPRERRNLVLRKLKTLPRKASRLLRRNSEPEVDLEDVIDLTHVSDREMRLWKLHLDLLVRHCSKPYRGHITLFRTRGHPILCSFEEDFGWGKLSPKVVVKKIPGSHEGVFMEPHVKSLAKELQEALHHAHQKSQNTTQVLNCV
jgi:amino acid adenylation domain-containing protein/FkbH-like protein